MVSEQPPLHDALLSPGVPDVRRYLQDWLARVRPDLAQAARYAALPHSFDHAMLSYLRGAAEDTDLAIARLERTGLIAAASPGRYTFASLLREPLLCIWQESDLEEYRRASARAAEYYASLRPAGEIERLEHVYHLLGADDPSGTEALVDAFGRAWSAGRTGLAERLLQYANEQAPVLGAAARAWLRLFEARLDLAHYDYAHSEDALRHLVAVEEEPNIRAEALLSLADTLVAMGRWSEALEHYARAQDLFLQIDEPFRAGQALAAQGLAFLRLASSLGGLEQEAKAVETRRHAWFRRIAHAPFVLYRWLSRRVAFLPNLYFGASYGDWIIFRLFYEAIDRFQRASRLIADLPRDAGLAVGEALTDIQIHLADLYHRIGRWNKARRLFKKLAISAPVGDSDYRRATLQLAEGRAALTRAAPDEARGHLHDARRVFADYGDQRALAAAARLLGDTEVTAGDLDAAMSHYEESAEASLAVDDLLASTHIWSTLGALRGRSALPPATQARVDALEQRLDRRAYLLRFRGPLLARFRRLAAGIAAYVVLPLTYLIVSLIHYHDIHRVLLLIPYLLLYQIVGSAAELPADILGGATVFVAGLLPAVWAYGLFYALAGWIFVRRLRLDDIARLEPEFVVTHPESLVLRDEKAELSELPWAEVASHISADRAIWRAPIALFSRLFLTQGATALAIEGVVRHYQSLQRDIAGRLGKAKSAAARHALDFSFLRSRWVLVALLLSMCMTAVALYDWLDRTCREPNIIPVLLEPQGYAYVSTADGSLHVVKTWDTERLASVGHCAVPGQITDLATAGGYVYVAAGDRGLRVVDVSEPAAPTEVSSLDTPGQATGVAVAGRYAYVADGSEGLRVVDITDPAHPVEAGSCDTPGQATGVAVAGGYAYVADGSEGLQVVRVKDPRAPTVVGECCTPGQAINVTVAGRYAYVADGDVGLRVVDVQDPTAPTEAISYTTTGHASGIVAVGSVVHVAAGAGGLRTIDVGNPAAPSAVGSSDTPGEAADVGVSLGYAYVADGAGGLRVVDVLNPCPPSKESNPFCAWKIGADCSQESDSPCGRDGDPDCVDAAGCLPELAPATHVAVPGATGLPITSISFEFFFWAVFFFPLAGLGRLLANRAALRRALGPRCSLGPGWPLWIALVLLLASMVYHLGSLTC